LSNLTEPTKPVVYTDRSGVVDQYLPTNYSLLFILFTRMRADALLSALVYTRAEWREEERKEERERVRERCSHKSKFHFNVLTKDQIKHFN